MIIASRNWRLLINVWFIFRRVHRHCTGTWKTTMGFCFWSKFNDLEARKIGFFFFFFFFRYKYGLCTNTMPSYLILQTNPAWLYSRLRLTTNVTAKMAIYHLFWKFLATKHCFRNKWQSITFSRTWVSETRVPHQFCHRGTVELEFVRLKKIMWYLSLVNSSTMQHSTRVYQTRVSFIIFFFFCFGLGIINK